MCQQRISILIPVYNNHSKLDALISSTLKYPGIFHIVVSDDNPSNFYQGQYYGDVRIDWLRNEVNLGRAKNYLRLLDHVKAERFMFMDGDDELAENVNWLELLAQFQLGDIIIGNFGKRSLNGEIDYVRKFNATTANSGDFLLSWVSWRRNPANGACIYKTKLLSEINKKQLEVDILNWDILWQRHCFLRASELVFVEDVIFIWNETGSNGSMSSSLSTDLKNFRYVVGAFLWYLKKFETSRVFLWLLRSTAVYFWFLLRKMPWKRKR